MSTQQTQKISLGHSDISTYSKINSAKTKSACSKYAAKVEGYAYNQHNLPSMSLQDQYSRRNEFIQKQTIAFQSFETLVPAEKRRQQSQLEDVSFRYFRYSDLSIKPIQSDSEEEAISTLEKHSQIETVTFYQPELIESQPVSKIAIIKKRRRKRYRFECRLNQVGPNQIEKWIHVEDKSLPQPCLNILVQSKKEVYLELMSCLTLFTEGKESKRMFLLTGQKQSGKKTLLFHTLSIFKKSKDVELQTYFIDLQKLGHKYYNKQFETIMSYLKGQINHSTQQKRKFDLFVVNSLQYFLYFLKKASLLHYFKALLSKLNNVAFIFVDSYTPKHSWLKDQLKIIEMGSNNIHLLASLLVAYVDGLEWKGANWTISRSLARYFCSKLAEQGHLGLKIISSLSSFLTQLQSKNQQLQGFLNQNQVISKGILQQFRQRYFPESLQVSIDRLNIHQKIVLIASYSSLKRHEQVLIPSEELQKWYNWACESLSLQPKSQKQFHRELLGHLETYKLIKVIKKMQRTPQSFILLKISVESIRQIYSVDNCLCKFFQQSS